MFCFAWLLSRLPMFLTVRVCALHGGFLLCVCLQDDGSGQEDDEEDKMASLCLDAKTPAKKHRKLRKKQYAVGQSRVLPSFVTLKYERNNGELWRPRVLAIGGFRALWLEFTEDNMQILFDEFAPHLPETSKTEDSEEEDGDGDDVAQQSSMTTPSKVNGGSEPGLPDETPDPPQKRRRLCNQKGVTWNYQRNVWTVRYTDAEGKLRAKTFKPESLQDDAVAMTMDEAVAFRDSNHCEEQ